VAATRFLPGVLFFLYALSFLERIAHRSTNLPHSPALCGHTTNGKTDTTFFHRLSNGKMAQGHCFRIEISHKGSISGSGCTQILQTQHEIFSNSNKGETGSFRIDYRLLIQYSGIHGFFSSEGVRGFSTELGSVILLKARTPSGNLLE
jgi:hypothetical protein